MSCSGPVSWEDLVAYWAGDLAAADEERVDEHLMGCGWCSAESARVSAVAQALRARIPPVVTRARLEELRAQGTRIRENAFAPDQRQTAVFPREVDLLIHRLTGFDLSNAARVAVKVFVPLLSVTSGTTNSVAVVGWPSSRFPSTAMAIWSPGTSCG